MTVFLVGVQAASMAHAGHVASLIAHRGARVAAESWGRPAGTVAALNEMERASRDLRGRPAAALGVTFERQTVVTEVRLEVAAVLPFLGRSVMRTVRLSREEFVWMQDR
jgi:hypothetical protein